MTQHNPPDNLESRLEALGRTIPASKTLAHRVMNEIDKERSAAPSRRSHDKFYIGRWIMRGTIGLAACATIGALLWNVMFTPSHAYGIDDVRDQLAKVKSLHIVSNDAKGNPIEVYVERPDKVYQLKSGQRKMQTGNKNMVLNDVQRSAMISPADPLEARFMVEHLIQADLYNQLIGPVDTSTKKVRTERVGDIEADVYEKAGDREGAGPSSTRREIFLNPRTGLPVKTVLYMASPGRPERAIATFDRIEANGPAPKGAFDFEVPVGYQAHKAPSQPEKQPGKGQGAPTIGGGHGGNLHLQMSYALNMNNKAILVCWALYDDRKAEDDMAPLPGILTIAGPKGAYVERLLRADEASAGYHWRWSLLVPSQANVSILDNLPTIVAKQEKNRLSVTMMPVSFPREELKQFILDAQKRTLPDDGKPLTLEEIEAKLNETPGNGL